MDETKDTLATLLNQADMALGHIEMSVGPRAHTSELPIPDAHRIKSPLSPECESRVHHRCRLSETSETQNSHRNRNTDSPSWSVRLVKSMNGV